MTLLMVCAANFFQQNNEVIDYILILASLVSELLEVHKITTLIN